MTTSPLDNASQDAPVPGGENVLVEFDEGIAWVTLNRPAKRNAINPALAYEMVEVIDALEVDERCGVLVLTGAGESFSAGQDIKEYFRYTDGLSAVERDRVFRANGTWQWRRLRFYPKPTIAMVNGWCFGGAFTPVVACDLAIAADEAQFGLSEINWGIIPAGVVTKALSDVMGQRDCMYYIMTGELFDGRQARQMGLVNESVPRAQLRERTRQVAMTLLEKNPTVLRHAKTAFHQVRSMSWEQAADFLMARHDQSVLQDPEKGRAQGMSQFLDEKSYRPGLSAYARKK